MSQLPQCSSRLRRGQPATPKTPPSQDEGPLAEAAAGPSGAEGEETTTQNQSEAIES